MDNVNNYKPAGNNILVEVIEAEKTTKSGVYMPGTLDKNTKRGKIVAVGNGLYSTTGTHIPMQAIAGQTVIFPQHSGTMVRIGTTEYIVLSENEALLYIQN